VPAGESPILCQSVHAGFFFALDQSPLGVRRLWSPETAHFGNCRDAGSSGLAEISIKLQIIFYRQRNHCHVLSAEMPVAERASTMAISWNGTPSRSRGVSVRRSTRVRRDEQHAKNARVAIILSVFLAFLAAAVLIGGRTVIDPMLRAAAEARQSKRIGEVVFTMPDGAFCRHLSFDNSTAEISESTLDRCPEARPRSLAKESTGVKKGFAWGVK
jgi:hypothetical protein